jgi:hypothetical protein
VRCRRAVLIASSTVLLTAAGTARPPLVQPRISVVEYATGMRLEHYQPPVVLAHVPVVVLVHGCCGDRRDLATLARALARRGAVVLNPDVHRLHSGGGWPASYRDVVCAVAEARVVAAELANGDHSVALVGWSDGALLGATVTLGWRELARSTTTCASPVGGRGPDRFVGIGGHYGWRGALPPPELVTPLTTAWFGATPDQDPLAWQEGNPQWWLAEVARGEMPPMDLIASVGDSATGDFAAALASRRVSAAVHTVHPIRDEGNLALSQPRSDTGDRVLRALCRILQLPPDPLTAT